MFKRLQVGLRNPNLHPYSLDHYIESKKIVLAQEKQRLIFYFDATMAISVFKKKAVSIGNLYFRKCRFPAMLIVLIVTGKCSE
jgi:hypothetical protein